MTAYTGGLLNVGFYYPVVVALGGMKLAAESVPIFRGHDRNAIVGHTDDVRVSDKNIKATGVISGTGPAAQEVISTAANGFPWQASIGARLLEESVVEAGETVEVNGKKFKGPVIVAVKSELYEISFVPIGADNKTKAIIAGDSMDFTKWLSANGFDPAALNEGQTKILRAQFDATEQKPNIDPPKPPEPPVDLVAEMRANAAKEAHRVAQINDICAKCDGLAIMVNGGPVNLKAHAIASGWTVEQTKVEVLQAQLSHVDRTVKAPKQAATVDVLEAAFCQTLGMNVEKKFKQPTLEALAASPKLKGISLHGLLLIHANENGYGVGPGERVTASNLRPVLQAAFSSSTLPQLLANVANKELATGYEEEDQSWRMIAVVKSVNDFKQVTVARLLDDVLYEEVGNSGEIKSGSLTEEYYTRQAKTYAKMLSLTRKDIINDDLGAFDDLRDRLGRGAARKLGHLVWAKFIDNSSFFTSGRGNYITGSTTNLGSDGVGLGLGVKAFRNLAGPSGEGTPAKKIGGIPTMLIVPPELEYQAQAFYVSQNLVGNTDKPSTNVYYNQYKPVVVPWLSDSSFTGYSTTAWYLLRDPKFLAAVVVSALGGKVEPTVESADADFNVLGIQMRGYADVAADQAEYLAGIKSKGAA